jgi:hypothetical protein
MPIMPRGGTWAWTRQRKSWRASIGAVFAGGVHALEDDEQGFSLACVKDVLKVIEGGAMVDEDVFRGLFGLEDSGIGGRYFGQPYLGVRLDEIGRLNFHKRYSSSRGYGNGVCVAGRLSLLD